MPRFRDIKKFTRNANYRVNMPWNHLDRWLESKDYFINLDPDFQRAHVWTELQQIRYVEFILRGGFSSRDIYWNCSSWMGSFDTPLELVDGKQRLHAVLKFMDDKLPAFGYTKDEYEDKFPWSDADFVFHVNNLQTREEVLQWYLDLNEGGVVHTNEELEKVRKLLKKEQRKRNE